jgi:nucleoid-associated protein YgaU
MAGQHYGKGTIVLLGGAALAVVVTLFGVMRWDRALHDVAASAVRAPEPIVAAEPRPSTTTPTKPAPETPSVQASIPAPAAAPTGQGTSVAAASPSFDLVRVEPDGESVIAGKAAAGATVELLSNGQVHARTAADSSGLFALVPPPLPPGSHEVTLQSIAPDGVRQRSRDSVTIVVADNRKTPPLVALSSPDKPTVLLSSPEPLAGKGPDTAAASREAAVQAANPSTGGAATTGPAPREDVKIVTVESEDSGRLFVSGRATPGATVRLYLNETFIAPGGSGGDGRVSFAIGRGVKPGDYRVRLDEVDPVSGQVRSRAEVTFNVPQVAAAAVAAAPASAAPNATGSASAAPPPAGNAPAAAVASATPQTGRPAAAPGVPVRPAGAPRAGAEVAQSGGAQVGGVQVGGVQVGSAQVGGAQVGSAQVGSAPLAAAPGGVAQGGAQVASVSAGERSAAVGTVVIPDVNTALVSKGDNLWRISHRIYGRGQRYTVIFGANQAQIRNPNLIYPGQVFVLPSENARTTP